MATATPYVFTSALHAHLVPYLAALHGSCITHDRMMGTFLSPLNHEKLLSWWREKIADVNADRRVILILLDESDPGSRANGAELVGAVMLAMPPSGTSPFRAAVESLLISPKYRSKGGARALMAVLETEAQAKGKTLLTADTESETAAEAVFKKLGYTEIGKIPRYGLNPLGQLKGGTFFYKDLASY